MPKDSTENDLICKIEELQRQFPSRARRIAFLLMRDNDRVNAKDEFERLESKNERTLRARFDHWLSGNNGPKNWFHGWTKTEFWGRYAECFVFKIKVRRLEARFYGYLCNPNPINRQLQICTLILHKFKKGWETDESDLRFVKEIGESGIVQAALTNRYRSV